MKIIGDGLRPQLSNQCPFCTKPRRINKWNNKLIGSCGAIRCANKLSVRNVPTVKTK